jgi:hypothetical protein
LYESCTLCGRLYPSSYMRTVYAKDRRGMPMPVRFCTNCLNPNLTYIAAGSQLAQFDAPRIFGLALAIIVALLNITLGMAAGGLLGLFLAVTGLLLGTGIAVAFMVSITCTQQGSSFS